ncbi:hypothetical protein J7I44_00025 [Frateuria sp. MAH-13]|uniref:Uncharacterized protein n=1 Tax=Frateuria flava TaxID=2821489 RepID=A0ABS4DHX9_9GAMM|nr:hypothetical protein [Frateuria flava]MBP1472670.1 hypothetical protein [Frateuria flava]
MTHQHALHRAAAWRCGHLIVACLAATTGLALSPAGAAGDIPPYDMKENPATLVYSIDIRGHAREANARMGTFRDTTVHRHLDGTVQLKGTQGTVAGVDNARQMIEQTAPARQIMGPAIQQAMATCGEDEACMTAAVMKLSADMKHNHPGVLEGATKAKDRLSHHGLGNWTIDAADPRCSLHALTQGTTHFRTIDAGEGYGGYVDGSQKRHGTETRDCANGMAADSVPRASAEWNGDTRTLQLQLPGLTVDEQTTDSDGNTDTAKVTIPDVSLDDLRWTGKGPQSGQQIRQVEAGDVPATMTIRWTFTPGKA